MDQKKTALVVSAHAADFVWRAGGAIALYARRGYRVRILCLSFGERGESERLWRQPGITLAAAELSLRTRVYAQAAGSPVGGRKLGAPPVFMFEPHQPEMCDFKPQLLLDITPVFDVKRQAMESMEAQRHLWEYCTDLAKRRGTQAVRNSGRQEIQYAEAFQRVYPQVTSEFS